MQTWLLDNARLTENKQQPAHRPRVQWIVLLVIVLLMVALVLAASQGRSAPQIDNPPQPTVTLVTTPSD